MRGSAVMLRTGYPEGDAADRFIAGLSVPTAEPAALVAEKFDFVLRCLWQCTKRWPCLIQAEIRHDETKFRAREFMTQI